MAHVLNPKQPVVSVSDIEKTSSSLYPRYSSATFIMNKAKFNGKKPKIESVATAQRTPNGELDDTMENEKLDFAKTGFGMNKIKETESEMISENPYESSEKSSQ